MPLTRIVTLKGRPSKEKTQIGEVVLQTVVDKLHVPANDRFLIIEELDRENLSFDPTCLDIERSDGFLIIQITLNIGRSDEVKKIFTRHLPSSCIRRLVFVKRMYSSILLRLRKKTGRMAMVLVHSSPNSLPIINFVYIRKEVITMSTLLYITAHPGNPEASYSLAAGEQFVQAYRESHPQDEVIHVDLYRRNIPYIDADVLEAWGKLQTGGTFNQLTVEQQQKVTQLNELLEEFVTADKYVFVTPMWNFSYPPVMKAYIDSFCVRAKTFKYTENGPVGLLKNKKRSTSKLVAACTPQVLSLIGRTAAVT